MTVICNVKRKIFYLPMSSAYVAITNVIYYSNLINHTFIRLLMLDETICDFFFLNRPNWCILFLYKIIISTHSFAWLDYKIIINK